MIFTHSNRVTAKFVALLAVFSMILSAFPASFFIAEAASLGVTLSDSTLSTPVDMQVNFVATVVDTGTTTSGTYIAVDDNGAGGDFYTGTVGGDCNAVTPDSDDEFSIIINKGVCYSNSTPGVYDIDVQLLDGAGGTAIGSAETVEITVYCADQYDSASSTTDIQNAATGDYFDSVNDALADCDTTDGDTIELLGNITTSEQITLDRPIVLDGGGFAIDAAFAKTSNSNNSAIGVQSNDVTVMDVTLDGTNGTDLHGLNVYVSDAVVVDGVHAMNFRSGLVVNGSDVDATDFTTEGNIWHGINVAQGSGVVTPAALTINETSEHAEVWPSLPHIYIDDTSQDATVDDVDGQYAFVEFPNPSNTSLTARAYYLYTPPSLTITMPAVDDEILQPSVYTFEAEYVDADDTFDAIRWAIRPGCSSGTNLAGNVGGFSDPSTYDGAHFEATVDMSTWADGDYCFIVNPAESSGDDFRELRPFTIEYQEPASLTITDPVADGETLSGVHTFLAEYYDDDDEADAMRWAIRFETCDAGVATVAGNVDGFSDSFDFTAPDFSAMVDMSAWDNGEYCLVINPDESGDGEDFRETRTFILENPLVCEPGVNLLANASFEDPIADDNAVKSGGFWELFESIPGWDSTADFELWNNMFGGASDGDQNAELATTEATKISQTIETIPGKEYTLSWDYSARPGTDKPESKMVVRVNGSKVDTNNKNGQATTNWKSKDYIFIADSTETTVSFEDRDKGEVAGKGPLLDNTSLTCDTPAEPEPEVGPYCGDGEINQPWEQCDLGYMGSEAGYDESGMCNATCQYDNQCVEVNLVRITLEDTESVSFDDTVYLGSALNELPNGVWFNFDEVGDDAAHTIANNSDGLGVERDTDTSELKLAFVGGNSMKKLDQALGSIELFGFEAGSINRQLNPQFKLEDGSGNSFDDYFFKSSPTVVDFDLRADTGNDGVILGLEDVDICEPDIIDGHKWNDENGNGYWDEGEEAMEGWTIYLESLNESEEYEDASTVTDENGYYYFMVDGGNWEVTEEERDGWVQTAPYGSCEFYLEEQVQEAKLLSIESEDWEHEYENENHCDFGNHYYFETITGFKWNDENDNGIWDTNESKLSGWTIELVDEEDNVASTTVTDADGYYSFNEVPEGVWTVREVEQEGWRQTAPASGSCEFEFVNPAIQKDFLFFDEVESDEDSKYTCDFGNYEGGEIRTGGSGSGGLSSSSASTPEEQVLGASTSQCGMYLYDYMKQGQENKVFEVQKLQLFLLSQKYYDVGLSGVFDSATDAGVKAFQAAHSADVLKPWVDLGFVANETPTGYVYKTTRWKINDMVCPGSESFPTLP